MECSTFPQDSVVVQQTPEMNLYLGNQNSSQAAYGLNNTTLEPIPNRYSRIRPNGLLARMALPCQTSSNWDYTECYSYYADGCYNTCQFVEMGDIEDFM